MTWQDRYASQRIKKSIRGQHADYITLDEADNFGVDPGWPGSEGSVIFDGQHVGTTTVSFSIPRRRDIRALGEAINADLLIAYIQEGRRVNTPMDEIRITTEQKNILLRDNLFRQQMEHDANFSIISFCGVRILVQEG